MKQLSHGGLVRGYQNTWKRTSKPWQVAFNSTQGRLDSASDFWWKWPWTSMNSTVSWTLYKSFPVEPPSTRSASERARFVLPRGLKEQGLNIRICRIAAEWQPNANGSNVLSLLLYFWEANLMIYLFNTSRTVSIACGLEPSQTKQKFVDSNFRYWVLNQNMLITLSICMTLLPIPT